MDFSYTSNFLIDDYELSLICFVPSNITHWKYLKYNTLRVRNRTSTLSPYLRAMTSQNIAFLTFLCSVFCLLQKVKVVHKFPSIADLYNIRNKIVTLIHQPASTSLYFVKTHKKKLAETLIIIIALMHKK